MSAEVTVETGVLCCGAKPYAAPRLTKVILIPHENVLGDCHRGSGTAQFDEDLCLQGVVCFAPT